MRSIRTWPRSDLVVAHQRHAEQVGDGEVVGAVLAQRREQCDDLLVLAHGQPAIGQKQRGLQLAGRRLVDLFQSGGGKFGLAGFVECQAEVEFDRRVAGLQFQRMAILRDGVLVARHAGVGGAQIGERHWRFRPHGQILLIFRDGAVDIAGLVQCDGLLQDFFRGIGLCEEQDANTSKARTASTMAIRGRRNALSHARNRNVRLSSHF